MHLFSKKLISFLLLVVTFQLHAQQQQLTEEQYFKGNFKAITATLPNIKRWIDDSHFMMIRDSKTYIVDAKTGTEKVSADTGTKANTPALNEKAFVKNNDLYIKMTDVEVQLTNDKDKEVNPTMSPDWKYVAYTKKNDLYTIDISSKKKPGSPMMEAM